MAVALSGHGAKESQATSEGLLKTCAKDTRPNNEATTAYTRTSNARTNTNGRTSTANKTTSFSLNSPAAHRRDQNVHNNDGSDVRPQQSVRLN